MEPKTAIYAGSFDPPTKGHLWMIEQGAKLFDLLIVAIGTNPEKTYLFDLPTRREMLCESVRHLDNVVIDNFPNTFLVDYAKSINVNFILRGIRNESDYLNERIMRHTNGDFAPEITTVFLFPPRELAEVSSSFVKNLVGPEKWEEKVCRYLSAPVLRQLKEKINAKTS